MSSIKNISNIIDAINSSSSPEQVSKTYIEGIKKSDSIALKEFSERVAKEKATVASQPVRKKIRIKR